MDLYHTIATIALIQPWVYAAWKKYFRPGNIEINNQGVIEVGYNNFDPIIGIYGTLCAIHRDQFIRNITLKITRCQDDYSRVFEWGAFRPTKIVISGNQEVSVDLPSGFMLTTLQPRLFNIMFLDNMLIRDLHPCINELQEAWLNTLFQAGLDGNQQPKEVDTLYKEFATSPVHVNAFAEVSRRCYWETGMYHLEMQVHTARPEKTYLKKWAFDLTSQDANRLRLNAINIVQAVCGRQVEYMLAITQYQNSCLPAAKR